MQTATETITASQDQIRDALLARGLAFSLDYEYSSGRIGSCQSVSIRRAYEPGLLHYHHHAYCPEYSSGGDCDLIIEGRGAVLGHVTERGTVTLRGAKGLRYATAAEAAEAIMSAVGEARNTVDPAFRPRRR